MTGPPIETVGDLIAALTAYPVATPVRLALHPGYPVAVRVGRVTCTPDAGSDPGGVGGDPRAHERVVWIGEGVPHGFLPVIARDALGNPWTTTQVSDPQLTSPEDYRR